MTRTVLLAAAFSAALAQMPPGSGEIHGRVLAFSSNGPLGPALVSLAGAPGAPQRMMAGHDGTFSFRQLPTGHMTLTVTKPGFLDVTQPVDVSAAASVPDLVVRMQRQAVIAGRLVDDRGTPLV